jgi:hypothetical protein
MSAFYMVGYLSLSVPAVAAGLAASALGLSETFERFSAAVVPLALAVAAGGLRIGKASTRDAAISIKTPPARRGPAACEQAA